MKRAINTSLRLTAFAAAMAGALPALATNGYFPHGYGIKAKGMGGVATATAEDSMGGATNPAKMVFVGSRADIGLEWFSPRRDAERSDALISPLNGDVTSDKTSFWVPEFGYNRMMSDTWSLGVTVYGNGGMNTSYPQGDFQCPTPTGSFVPANMLCGSGTLGVDLMQLVVAPTVAFKVAPAHSLGASLLLGYQRFEAKGLQAFDNAMFSSSPGNVTNRGYDSSTGVGVRLGYMGKLTDQITVGAAWSSKINMSRFDKYEGLFAEQGDFDIPSNYGLGIAFQPHPAWTLAFDYERINYSDTPSVSNPSQVMAPLGASNGPGFGWKDIDVYKVGVAWQMRPDLTLRAGFNYGENPISSADVTFNILAPGVMKQHYTGGFTWAVDPKSEFSGAFMYAPRVTVSGASLFDGVFGMPGAGGTETIGMKQYSLSLGWSWKF